MGQQLQLIEKIWLRISFKLLFYFDSYNGITMVKFSASDEKFEIFLVPNLSSKSSIRF